MMKSSISLLVFLVLATVAQGQNVTYKVLSNEPPTTPRFSLNSDLIHVDMMYRTLDGYSINASLWGHFEPVREKIGIQYLFRKSYFSFGRLGNKSFPGNTELEAGGYYVLNSKLKNKKTNIVLKKEYSGSEYSINAGGGIVETRHETTTFIQIPADHKNLFMARGGFYFKQHGNNTDYIDGFNGPDYVKFMSVGLYAGINFRDISSIFVDTDEFGVQFNSVGRDVYIDLLVLPVNSFSDIESGANINDQIKNEISALPFGFRAGYRLFQVDKKKKTGKLLGICGNLEAGYKPFIGFTLSAGAGFTFIK